MAFSLLFSHQVRCLPKDVLDERLRQFWDFRRSSREVQRLDIAAAFMTFLETSTGDAREGREGADKSDAGAVNVTGDDNALARRQQHKSKASARASARASAESGSVTRERLEALRKELHHRHVSTGQLFNEMDTKRHNSVSFNEFRRGLAMAGVLNDANDAELHALFKSFDTDGDHLVTYQEVLAALEGELPDIRESQTATYNPREQQQVAAMAELATRLPTETSTESIAARRQMFSAFDPNGNGYLSLAEVDKGVRDVLSSSALFDVMEPAIRRAFQAAKGAADTKSKLGAEFVEKSEFFLLLVYLKRYFELFVMFNCLDTGHDKRVDIIEFTAAIPKLDTWGVFVDDPATEFARVDTNGSGQITFAEFCDWATTQHLATFEREEGKADVTRDDDVLTRGLQKSKSSTRPPTRVPSAESVAAGARLQEAYDIIHSVGCYMWDADCLAAYHILWGDVSERVLDDQVTMITTFDALCRRLPRLQPKGTTFMASSRRTKAAFYVDKGDFFATLDMFFPDKDWGDLDVLKRSVATTFRSGGFVDINWLLGGAIRYPMRRGFQSLLRAQHMHAVVVTTAGMKQALKVSGERRAHCNY